MEELHRIHKDVPFGYWIQWVEPAYRTLRRRLADRRRGPTAKPAGHDRIIAMR